MRDKKMNILCSVLILLVLLFAPLACEKSKQKDPKSLAGPIQSAPGTPNKIVERPGFIQLAGTFTPITTWRLVSSNAGRVLEIPVIEGQSIPKGNLLLKIEDEKLPFILERQHADLKDSEGKMEQYAQQSALEDSDSAAEVTNVIPSPPPEERIYPELSGEEIDDSQLEGESPGLSLLQKYARVEREKAEAPPPPSPPPVQEPLRPPRAKPIDNLESRMRLEEARMGRVKAEIALTEKQINDNVIYSILDGMITKLSVREGQSIKPDDLLAEVTQLDPIELKVLVPKDKVDKIEKGMEAQVSIQDLPGQSISGEVSFLGVELDKDHQLEVRIRIANPNLKIKADTKGTAEIAMKPASVSKP